MKRLFRSLSAGAWRVLILVGMVGLGLWLLARIAQVSAMTSVTAPVGAVASRYRRFAQTGG